MEPEEIEFELGKRNERKTSYEEKRQIVIRCLSKPRRIGGKFVGKDEEGHLIIEGGKWINPEPPTDEQIEQEIFSLDEMMERYRTHRRLNDEEFEIKKLMQSSI